MRGLPELLESLTLGLVDQPCEGQHRLTSARELRLVVEAGLRDRLAGRVVHAPGPSPQSGRTVHELRPLTQLLSQLTLRGERWVHDRAPLVSAVDDEAFLDDASRRVAPPDHERAVRLESVFVDAGGDGVACDDVTPDLLRVGVEPFGRLGGNGRRLPSYH